jgi:hypothetical protein
MGLGGNTRTGGLLEIALPFFKISMGSILNISTPQTLNLLKNINHTIIWSVASAAKLIINQIILKLNVIIVTMMHAGRVYTHI